MSPSSPTPRLGHPGAPLRAFASARLAAALLPLLALVAPLAAPLAALVAAGCEPALEARLIQVHEVGPPQLTPGQRVSLRGDGFPAGRPARLRLTGTFYRPGREPEPARVTLDAHALSVDLVEARIEESLVERLGGRGTFRGELAVLFESPGSEAHVTGVLPDAVLDFSPPTRERLAGDLRRLRGSEALLEELGIVLVGGLAEAEPEAPGEERAQASAEAQGAQAQGAQAQGAQAQGAEPGGAGEGEGAQAEAQEEEADEDAPGLGVASVVEGSLAARAGLRPGDRVLALNGLRLLESVDFVLAEDAEEALLEVARPGEAAPFEVALPRASAAGRGFAEGLAFQLGALWALIALFWISPLARFTGGALGLSARPPLLGGRRPAPARLTTAAAAARIVLLSLLFTAIPWVAEHSGLSIVPLVLAAGATRLCLSQMGLSRPIETHAAESREGRLERGRRSLLRMAHGGLGLLLVTAAVGGAAAAAGTVELRGLHEAQGLGPAGWTLARLPSAPLLLLLFFAGASFGPQREGRFGPEPASGLALSADDLALAVYALAGALAFLGGWQGSPGAEVAGLALPTIPARIFGVGAFALKAWLLWLLMRRARDRAPFHGLLSSAWLLLGAAVALAATGAWLWLSPPDEVARMGAHVALAFSAISLLILLFALLRERKQPAERMALRPAYPFL